MYNKLLPLAYYRIQLTVITINKFSIAINEYSYIFILIIQFSRYQDYYTLRESIIQQADMIFKLSSLESTVGYKCSAALPSQSLCQLNFLSSGIESKHGDFWNMMNVSW
jgi:hypothetical protein